MARWVARRMLMWSMTSCGTAARPTEAVATISSNSASRSGADSVFESARPFRHPGRVEHHRRRDHGPGERPAADLVHPGDGPEPFAGEPGFRGRRQGLRERLGGGRRARRREWGGAGAGPGLKGPRSTGDRGPERAPSPGGRGMG
jgi:hypothetical protein